jgi:hypothetical protein
MAAKKKKDDTEVLSVQDAMSELTEARRGRGRGRTSKYEDTYAKALELYDEDKEGVVKKIVEGYDQVNLIRGTLERRAARLSGGEDKDYFTVKSTKHPEDSDKDNSEARYITFIFRTQDIEE